LKWNRQLQLASSLRQQRLGDLHGYPVNLQEVFVPFQVIEEQGAGCKSIGNNDVSASGNIVFVHSLHGVRVGQVGVGAPRLSAHRHPAPLDIRARAAIENDSLAAIEFALDIFVHDGTLIGLGSISSRIATCRAKCPHEKLRLERMVGESPANRAGPPRQAAA
jgi:hypothetical protein